MGSHYQVIADDLRHLIESGEYAAGSQLPSEKELAARYKVSHPTLRSALDVLQADGLLEKFHGRGNFVRRQRERITYVGEGHPADQRASLDEALKVDVNARQMGAHPALSELLDVPVDTRLTEYTYLSHLYQAPQTLARVYVPWNVAELKVPKTSRSPWGEDIRSLLAGAGVDVASTVERVTARLPRTEEANLLHITTKTPVIAIERTSFDADGHVVELALLVLRGDRTEAVFTHRKAAPPEVEDCVDSGFRLLPWDSPEGKPCLLSVDCASSSALSQIADNVETEQTNAGAEVLSGAKSLLAEPEAGEYLLRFALARTVEALGEVLRVAQSRGARLSVPAYDEPEDEDENEDNEAEGEDSGSKVRKVSKGITR
ncbi:GntR family transcriptional regulator [Streptomyces sp. NPDC051173]|uniref:GntR family transcriptional regulator n=1 Tax=Streptomyces sp. NPDC051173 TaxID=3155164 RepID=UPI0034506777